MAKRSKKSKKGKKWPLAWDRMLPLMDLYGSDTLLAQIASYDGKAADKFKLSKEERLRLYNDRMRRFDLMLRSHLGV